jgi:hypothetical protein
MRPNELHSENAAGNMARREALLCAVGLWKDRTDLPDTGQYIRELREDDRLRRIAEGSA